MTMVEEKSGEIKGRESKKENEKKPVNQIREMKQ